jgi:hypothetical protein
MWWRQWRQDGPDLSYQCLEVVQTIFVRFTRRPIEEHGRTGLRIALVEYLHGNLFAEWGTGHRGGLDDFRLD